MVPWTRLSSEAKGWNRSQAAHIPVKLRLIGCRAVPTLDWDVPHYAISEAEVDLLARIEHERWVKERVDAGWKWGPKNDPALRTNPYLVLWELLDKETMDLDRVAVRGIPAFLAKAGFQVVKS